MKGKSFKQSFCAVEITRIHEFPEKRMRDEFVREKNAERMSICFNCATSIRRKRRQLGNEFDRMDRMLTVGG